MSLISRVRSNYYYARGLGGYLRDPITLEEARASAERGLSARSQSFLQVLERYVYNDPRNPYFRLLEHAGIELGDVRGLLDEAGLEGTLQHLYDAGVYLTQEEHKGSDQVRRGSLKFRASIADLADRTSATFVGLQTSGSTGTPLSLSSDSARERESTIRRILGYAAVRGDRPMAAWDAKALGMAMSFAKAGMPLQRHFTTNGFRWTAEGFRTVVLNYYTLLVARLSGRPTPRPQYASRESSLTVVKWLAARTAEGSPALLDCPASLAVRACLYASEHSFDISGTLFLVHGEPFTLGKAEVLKSVGTEARARYSM